MKEKIFEFQLDHPLSCARRKALFEYIETNAHRVPWGVDCEWNAETKVLRAKTNVVQWELVFLPKKLEVFGSGPFWAKMMFTEALREKLRLGISLVLEEVGLVNKALASPKKKKIGKR